MDLAKVLIVNIQKIVMVFYGLFYDVVLWVLGYEVESL